MFKRDRPLAEDNEQVMGGSAGMLFVFTAALRGWRYVGETEALLRMPPHDRAVARQK